MNILNVKSAEIKPCQDLDIVAVSESQCEARTATPDALDSPPAMPDSRLPIMQTSCYYFSLLYTVQCYTFHLLREGSLGASSPVVSLPDAPSSEPGSPQLQVIYPRLLPPINCIFYPMIFSRRRRSGRRGQLRVCDGVPHFLACRHIGLLVVTKSLVIRGDLLSWDVDHQAPRSHPCVA